MFCLMMLGSKNELNLLGVGNRALSNVIIYGHIEDLGSYTYIDSVFVSQYEIDVIFLHN